MYPCEIKNLPDRPVLSRRFRSLVGELPRHFSDIYAAIANYMASTGAVSNGPAFATYHNMDMADLDVEAGFLLVKPAPGQDEIIASTIRAGTFAVGHYTGAYDGLGQVYEELQNFIGNQGYRISGVPTEWYLNGPETPPQGLKTDVEFPIVPLHETAHA